MAQITVTVRTRQPGAYPVVSPDDVRVYENNKSRPVVSWVPARAQSGPLDLTILMDDSIRAKVGLQFKDLADFLQTLPAGTRVRVAYASDGGNRIVRDFTSDYPLAAKALRLPMGSTMAGGSIYESVADLLKNWPRDGNRRGLLVISDGIDINQGFVDSQPTLNIELQRAIDLAQSTNVPIYTIFARGARSLERNWFLLNNGQSCLLRLTSETGGQSYFQGTRTPLAFAPFLKQFANDLRHQYVLTFQPLPAPRAGYQRLRVTTEIPEVHLFAPTRVFIPKAG
jgi:VWFA-related protein